VSNPALESNLPTKVDFKKSTLEEEWATFGIAHLHFDYYVMSNINDVAHYPASTKFE